MENKVICEVCPVLNIVHASGERSDVKYCVMEAALKQAKERYATCGENREIVFNEAPVEQPVAEQAPLTSSLDELESAVEQLEEQK